MKTSLGYLRALADDREKQDQAPPVVYTGNVGRPGFEITREQMNFLVESGFTGPQIASIIGVSLNTVRRMAYFGLSIGVQYASVMDSELDDLVREIKQYFPMCGNKQLQGHLLSHGFQVQQQQVRDSQRQVDPEGSIMRRLQAVSCRKYQILSPRSLWHMDGNHKSIRCALANGY